MDYIHKNPITRGLVDRIEDWKWSSWHNYYREENAVFMIDKVDVFLKNNQ